MTQIIDCHTHNLDSTDGIISVSPDFSAFEPGKAYSVGIHPWDTSDSSEIDFSALESAARHPQVVAVGECGLDRLRGAPLEVQTEIFRRHIQLSESLHKPLIVHCVRCAAELLGLYRAMNPAMPWIYHGFRGRPELAGQLADAGIFLSFGVKYNELSLIAVPDDKILVETDDSSLGIHRITGLFPAEKVTCAAENLQRLLSHNY